MKKTLAIVLALAMVLCMIPASFAAVSENKTITGKSYNIYVNAWHNKALGDELGKATDANSVTAEYNYEKQDDDVTGMFDEDAKMAIVKVDGFDASFSSNAKVYIDGKQLEVNALASYYPSHVGYDAGDGAVYFPVQLTKAGYSDTYLVEVTETDGDKTMTETAKVSIKLVNTASYKNAKTATIQNIVSNSNKLDAYIVGSKIYLDFVNESASGASKYDETVDITFKDENGKLFDVVTWAYEPGDGVGIVDAVAVPDRDRKGVKLDDATATYYFYSQADKVTFELETSSNIYETKEYTIVKRFGIEEADPKGIYFAESTKTIKIGEEYTPVVMGVATGKKVNADILVPDDTDRQVVDVDDNVVTGTQEGVAYITAQYELPVSDGQPVVYKASSMKIVVTAGNVEEPTDGAKYVVTASSLNVRSGAGTGYSKIGSLKNGAIVEVETIANGWAKLANGGYVSAQYLSKVVENGEAVTMYVTCRTLNVRKGPGTSYAKAGTLSRGTAVQVVGMTGSWAKLSNGTYVSANYLSK